VRHGGRSHHQAQHQGDEIHACGIEAPTLWGCAHLVWAKYQQWCSLSHLIERTRLTAKQAIANATTNDAVRAVYAGVKWP
jgi:hypothetical protein